MYHVADVVTRRMFVVGIQHKRALCVILQLTFKLSRKHLMLRVARRGLVIFSGAVVFQMMWCPPVYVYSYVFVNVGQNCLCR